MEQDEIDRFGRAIAQAAMTAPAQNWLSRHHVRVERRCSTGEENEAAALLESLQREKAALEARVAELLKFEDYTAKTLTDRAEKAEARVVELEKLVYVPGVWKCAKCGLRLVSSTLNAHSGSVTANSEPQQCPNGCGPLWRVTERDAGNDLCDRLDKCADELAAARKDVDRYRLYRSRPDHEFDLAWDGTDEDYGIQLDAALDEKLAALAAKGEKS